MQDRKTMPLSAARVTLETSNEEQIPLAFRGGGGRTVCSLVRRQLKLVPVFCLVWVYGVPFECVQLLKHLTEERRAQQIDLHHPTHVSLTDGACIGLPRGLAIWRALPCACARFWLKWAVQRLRWGQIGMRTCVSARFSSTCAGVL